MSGVLCKGQGSWCFSFLSGSGLEVERYLSGEVDRELVECCGPLFDRVGPFLLSVAQGEPQELHRGVFGWEMAPRFDHLAQLPVHRFDAPVRCSV